MLSVFSSSINNVLYPTILFFWHLYTLQETLISESFETKTALAISLSYVSSRLSNCSIQGVTNTHSLYLKGWFLFVLCCHRLCTLIVKVPFLERVCSISSHRRRPLLSTSQPNTVHAFNNTCVITFGRRIYSPLPLRLWIYHWNLVLMPNGLCSLSLICGHISSASILTHSCFTICVLKASAILLCLRFRHATTS